jgi:hypothetical protein
MTKFQLLVNNGVSAKLKQELAVKQPNTTSHLTSRGPSQQCFLFLEKNFAHDKEIAKIMNFFFCFSTANSTIFSVFWVKFRQMLDVKK